MRELLPIKLVKLKPINIVIRNVLQSLGLISQLKIIKLMAGMLPFDLYTLLTTFCHYLYFIIIIPIYHYYHYNINISLLSLQYQ